MILKIRNYQVLIDTEDFQKVCDYKWRPCINKSKEIYFHSFYYIKLAFNKRIQKTIRLHRFLMNCPKNKMIDHINGDTLDNRKSNLRICTNSENLCNRGKTKKNTSGFKGVSWNKFAKKWTAEIKFKNKKIYLGLFMEKEQAYKKYCEAALKYHGEFAKI